MMDALQIQIAVAKADLIVCAALRVLRIALPIVAGTAISKMLLKAKWRRGR